ncbi:F0F1 ATP synthase subunit B [Helicobacter sp. MIT 99-5507]|uniref:F0F1 ATP synthase subunit B n=1 Tax=Helicobacter sp. MIT 99-5507 TaxID=152489 RepID=UPI000E1E61A9|nr:F0F1 ATP synthase subunit B [Helicobacter sp. MIT 99-5507]RDU58392.1 hypothetical protein CQA42_00965 [Helicobacter sp. MIT 99-5507]
MKLLYLFLLPISLMASEVNIAESDIIERTINFVIFVVILWYFAANKIKMALQNRQNNIANQLDAVQDRLSQSQMKKEEALKALEKSKQNAKEIIENAKKEAEIIVNHINEQCKNDIETMNKNHKERINFEQKRMKNAVIDDIINELLSNNNITLNKKDYIDILLKRIA